MASTLLVNVGTLQLPQTDLPGYHGVVGQVLASDLIKGWRTGLFSSLMPEG